MVDSKAPLPDGASADVGSTDGCHPTTCAAEGKNCGTISNGCTKTIACGTCSGTDTCGGAGSANVCGAPAAGCAAGPAGVWQNITPPALDSANWCIPAGTAVCPEPGMTGSTGLVPTFGAHSVALDPLHPGTVYLGTASLGIWKTTQCGAGSSWTHVDTGTLGSVLDAGRNWTMVVDFTDSQVIYTVAGYGQGGLYKSIDGGVNWTQLLPSAILSMTESGFVEKITMDPTDHEHLLASFHTPCTGTATPGSKVIANSGTDPTNVSLVTTPTPTGSGTSYSGWGCMAETHDSGSTWSVISAGWPWSGGDGPGQTMVDKNTWFYGTNSGDGLWITTNGDAADGPTWTEVSLPGASSPTVQFATGGVYIATDGTFYTGGTFQVIHSVDGMNWTSVGSEYAPAPFSVNGSISIVDTGKTLYAVNSGEMSTPYGGYYFTSPLGSSGPFTATTTTPMLEGGAYLAYDPVNNIIYSANLTGGFWRLVLP
jgi:hypothetical protein